MGRNRRHLRIGAPALVLAILFAMPAVAAAPAEVIVDEPYYLSVHNPAADPHGTVLTLHGGGWRGDLGARADNRLRRWIARLTDLGYRVANLGYRGQAASLDDALAAFRVVHKRFGDGPICLWGQSTGAHLSLMVAARRGGAVDCVVDFAGPSYLPDWGVGNHHGRRLATRAFGAWRLRRISPMLLVGAIEARVLVASARCDGKVGIGQQRKFKRRLRRSGSPANFHAFHKGRFTHIPHCDVSRKTFEAFLQKQERFLGRAMPRRE